MLEKPGMDSAYICSCILVIVFHRQVRCDMKIGDFNAWMED